MLTLEAIYLGERTDKPATKDAKPWRHDAWSITLRHGAESMSFDYRSGIGNREEKTTIRAAYLGDKQLRAHGWIRDTVARRGDVVDLRRYYKPKTPTLFDALYCLCADSQDYDGSRSFEEWAGNYGYDSDSRTAERIYHQCAEQAKNLRRVLGAELYSTLVALDEDALCAWCEAQSSEREVTT